MVQQPLNVAFSDGSSQVLWEDGERVLSRGWRLDDNGNQLAVLLDARAVGVDQGDLDRRPVRLSRLDAVGVVREVGEAGAVDVHGVDVEGAAATNRMGGFRLPAMPAAGSASANPTSASRKRLRIASTL